MPRPAVLAVLSVSHCAVGATRARARRWGKTKRADERFGWMHTVVKLLKGAQALLPEHSVKHHDLSLVTQGNVRAVACAAAHH